MAGKEVHQQLQESHTKEIDTQKEKQVISINIHAQALTELKPKYGTWHYNGKVRLIKLDRKNYDELWYGAKNFYVITRYNHSSYYAMAVYQLAQKIKKEYKKLYGDLKQHNFMI